VYDRLFPKDEPHLRKAFLEMLAGTENVRLNWEGVPNDAMSSMMPWECLCVPTAPVNFLALTRKYSLTRRNPLVETETVQPIGGTLRLLFASARPQGLPSLPFVELESQILSKVVEQRRVELRMLPHVTLEELHQNLREFRPHVFHFSGHGVYREGQPQGELVLEQPAGTPREAGPRLLAADRLAVLLHDNDVLLAVLNACETGISSTNDAISSVAGALVHTGVPAVVATMRYVVDEAAMLFTREFYRSFLAGFTVEGAMAEARKILNSEYWDWSAYALFVGSADLNALRIFTPVRSDASR
jgi:CHAT domain-containing protein